MSKVSLDDFLSGKERKALTLNRSGFLQIGMAGGGQIMSPSRNF